MPVALDEASVCGRERESGAESGEERLAERSRSERRPRPQTEARRSYGSAEFRS
jgi:hypothetical protein